MGNRTFDEPYSNLEDSLRVERKREAVRELCYGLKGIRNIKEYFGGLGYMAETLLKVFPKSHILCQEISDKCLLALRHRLPISRVKVKHQDFFNDCETLKYDLITLDWNTFTLLQYRKNKPLQQAIKRVLSCQPRCIILNDSAINK